MPAPVNNYRDLLIGGLQAQARDGIISAQAELGFRLINGINGVERDIEAGIEMLQLAAAQGSMRANYNLGVIYSNGMGVEEDLTKAAHLFRQAADKGHDQAQYALGVLYQNGRGVDQNFGQAVHWLTKAHGQNDILGARTNLLDIYEELTSDVPRNIRAGFNHQARTKHELATKIMGVLNTEQQIGSESGLPSADYIGE